MQAQPNKVKLGAKDEQTLRDKLLLKAKVMVESANRIWRKFFPNTFCPASGCVLMSGWLTWRVDVCAVEQELLEERWNYEEE
jgi:hypothetical protein